MLRLKRNHRDDLKDDRTEPVRPWGPASCEWHRWATLSRLAGPGVSSDGR